MILLVNALNFAPEVVGCGKYTSELVYWLTKKVDLVIVVTTNAYYPYWKCISNKYKKTKIDNLIIYRSIIFIPKKINGLSKLIHLASFFLFSLPLFIKCIKYKPDGIFTVCPTIFSAPSSLLVSFLTKIIFRKKLFTWIHFQDFEIDAAFNLKILKGDWINNIFLKFEKFLINQFDIASTISNSMKRKLLNKVNNQKKVKYLPNFINSDKYKFVHKKENPYYEELNLKKNLNIIMYSGTLNEKLSYKILISAVKLLSYRKDIFWIIAGEGPTKIKIINELRNYNNVKILGFQPDEKLSHWLNLADIHLVPQKLSALDFVLPSKLLGILASGKPIIGFATEDSELGRILDMAGIRLSEECTQKLIGAIIKLINNPKLRERLGKKGQNYVKDVHEKEKVLNRFLKEIKNLV